MYDNICKFLAETYPQDIAQWLLGAPIPLTVLPPTELALEPIRADSLIILRSHDLILHLEFQTRPDVEIPFRMLDYWTRARRKFPSYQVRQIVIYLVATNSDLVHRNYFQHGTTRHEFEVLRLWECAPDVLLQSAGTLPFAILARACNREELLQDVVQRIEGIAERKDRAEVSATVYVLAGLVLGDNVIKQILRSEMMRESATFQAILHEGEALGERRGEVKGEQRGEARGILKGKRQTIMRQLTRKFGNLPLDIVAKIEMLSVEQLENLAEEILDMGSVNELSRWL